MQVRPHDSTDVLPTLTACSEMQLAVLACRCQLGLTLLYLADELHRVVDVGSRQQLPFTTTSARVIPATIHCTISD
jgi:hypothetical protein